MTRFVTLWLAALCWFSGSACADPDYLLLEDYYRQHPEQLALTEALRAQVQAPAQRAGSELPAISIAVVYPTLQQSDYWRRSLQTLQQRLDQIGLSYRLRLYATRPVVDEVELQYQIRDALQHDPDYLIFTLDSPAHRRVIERLLARPRPKLILQNITTPVRVWSETQPLLYTGFDHQQGSRILADTLFNGANPPRRISVIFRDRGYVSAMRGYTFIQLAEAAGAEVVSSYYTDGDEASAYRATLDALDHDADLDLIYACATDVAFGVQRALKERGLQQQIQVNGWGGGADELDALAAGELDLTVVRLNQESSIAMADAILNDLEGRPVAQVYSGQMQALTRHHSAAEQQALRRRAFPTPAARP